MAAELALDPFYYLQNFSEALSWIEQRHADVLTDNELTFIRDFGDVPRVSQALLVRLIMRKGPDFRASKVRYEEIGDVGRAAKPLIERGWLDDAPELTVAELCRLLRRDEINALFPHVSRHVRKIELIDSLSSDFCGAKTFDEWCHSRKECVYRVTIAPLCTRLRLLFFGSFHQDWSEFVLTDLRIFNYESIALSSDSRPFRDRRDLDLFVSLFECRERLHADATLDRVLEALPMQTIDNAWLESRRAKLLFQMAHRAEREGDVESALSLYEQSAYPGARLRRVRVLERSGQFHQAFFECRDALAAPESDAERQKLARVDSRLRRRLNIPSNSRQQEPVPLRLDVTLEPQSDTRVERVARDHLETAGSRVFYVENALINSLFGLLCWDAIFAPIRGAFFHRFHAAPMDLLSPEFHSRREREFERCFDRLTSGEYVDCIKRRFANKFGIQSPFVAWGLLSEDLLDVSLACFPAHHLRLYFGRLLSNLQENCTGLPDLVQFWPDERRYRMVEVKGPGDRLQDNQKRWMSWCVQQSLPVCVLHVRWAAAGARADGTSLA